MECYLRKGYGDLIAADEEADEVLQGIQPGEIVKAKISRPRNPGNHRRYFEFIRQTFDMQEKYSSIEQFRKVLQIKAGHYEAVIAPNGKMLYWPRSIAWDKLEEPEFKELFSNVIDAFIELFGQGLDEDEFRQTIGFV